MYSMSICLLPICLFIVMSYVTLLSMEEIKNTYIIGETQVYRFDGLQGHNFFNRIKLI